MTIGFRKQGTGMLKAIHARDEYLSEIGGAKTTRLKEKEAEKSHK